MVWGLWFEAGVLAYRGKCNSLYIGLSLIPMKGEIMNLVRVKHCEAVEAWRQSPKRRPLTLQIVCVQS